MKRLIFLFVLFTSPSCLYAGDMKFGIEAAYGWIGYDDKKEAETGKTEFGLYNAYRGIGVKLHTANDNYIFGFYKIDDLDDSCDYYGLSADKTFANYNKYYFYGGAIIYKREGSCPVVEEIMLPFPKLGVGTNLELGYAYLSGNIEANIFGGIKMGVSLGF